MKKHIYTISILMTFVFSSSFAQSGKVKKAVKQYHQFSYVKSTEELLKLVENGNTSSEILESLANAYYFNNKMEDAAKWYEKLMESGDASSETYFRYAQSLKAIKDYKKANEVMGQFSVSNSNDSRAKAFNSTPDYLKTIDKLSGNYDIESLEINSEYSDFGASFYRSGIYFASSRGKGKNYNWNEQPFLNIYWNNGSPNVYALEGDVNSQYHESSSAFTKDGKTMYFTRNNFYKGKFSKSSNNINGLKIYRATLVDGKWSNIESLPFNSDDYNVAHPALNADNTKLYFASDMEGSFGNSDIYVVSINEDGTFGTPQNLGAKINTEGRENFPYVSADGTLYFSSDGHLGLGGLDVFEIENADNISSISTKVYNLGKPVNSSKDDFAFIINDMNKGYFSSNREGGKGDDDIYAFTKKDCFQEVTGEAVNSETKELLSNTEITIYDESNNEVFKSITNANGAFLATLKCGETYTIKASKEEYKNDEAIISTHPKIRENVSLILALEPEVKVAEVGTDLFKLLDLKPIYFDFNKSNIRPDAEIELAKIIDYMKKFPTVKIDVRSHTDSRGRDSYNFKLSNKRNVSTIKYITDNGIQKDRITGKGYGETQLINKCKNGVKCSDEEHEKNRRSEFIVTAN